MAEPNDRKRIQEHDERAEEARRELQRLGHGSGLFSTPMLKRRAHSLGAHFTGKDADAGDRIEVWGTRIGRGLGLIAFIGLLVWLVLHLSH
ncbi:MAG TPA: hypothetical protein VFJ18_15360 [Pararhizobium sp.]|jgi:hypothetical protein|nr:hypothetical protein [Pararhizobium sp.]